MYRTVEPLCNWLVDVTDSVIEECARTRKEKAIGGGSGSGSQAVGGLNKEGADEFYLLSDSDGESDKEHDKEDKRRAKSAAGDDGEAEDDDSEDDADEPEYKGMCIA